MITVKRIEEGADQHLQLLTVLGGGEHLRRHFLIQKNTAGDLIGRELGNGFEYGGRTVLVGVVRRAASLSQRLKRISAVGGGLRTHALTHVCADGGGACIADAADWSSQVTGVRILFDLVDIRRVCVHDKLIHCIIVVSVFRRVLDQHPLDLLILGGLEIVQNGVPKLLPCDLLFIVDQLFDGREAVGHVGDADLQAGNEVVNGAALLDGAAAGDAVVRQRRAEHVGDVTLRCLVDKVLYDHAVSGHFTQRLVPGCHQLIVGCHILKEPIALDEPLAGGHIHTVIHDAQQQAREVDVGHTCAAVAPLAGNGSFHAADRAVIVGVLLGNAPVDKRGNDDLIVIECRHAEAKTHDLDAFVKELRVKVFVIADGQVGLRQARLRDGLKHHKA